MGFVGRRSESCPTIREYMLLNLTSLFGVSVLAKDGNIGHVRDVLFHDRSWVVRYFVVETGSWFSGRRVLLSPFIFLQPEWKKRVLPVDLTIEEVRQSPDVDTDLPVYRQQEIAMTQHYGWPAYWTMEASKLPGEKSEPEGDPDLRSANEILTYKVKTSDGDLGRMDDLVVEDANWFIRFLVLSTGSWFEGQKLLVATRWVGSVSWANKEVVVPHSRDAIWSTLQPHHQKVVTLKPRFRKVKGQDQYLYRAVDSTGQAIDFLLTPKADTASAKRLFRKVFENLANVQPRVIKADRNPGYPGRDQGAKRRRHAAARQCRYLNNIIEQDHRTVKRRALLAMGWLVPQC
jgi:uncharacterized protein YrrD